MTENQKRLRELRDRQSRERGRMSELAIADSLTDETRAELDEIEKDTADLERQLRAAQIAVDDEDREAKSKGETAAVDGDPAQRERIELRNRASVGAFIVAALRGRAPDGAEAELQQAAGVDGIPFELWQPPEQRREDRAITPAPGTVGVNLDVLRPFVFAPSVVSRLMVDMPEVPSGTFRQRHNLNCRHGGRGGQIGRRARNGRDVHRHNHNAAPYRCVRKPGVGRYCGGWTTEFRVSVT